MTEDVGIVNGAALRLETVSSEQEFANMAEEWNALVASSRQDGPFLRHEWLSAWWDTFGGGELSIVTCRNGDRLVGVLPTFTVSAGRLPPARTARFLGDEGVGSTGLTPFAAPDSERQVFGRLARYVREASEWHVADFRFMDENDFFGTLAEDRRSRVYDDCGSCPRIDLPEDWDAYLRQLSKHMRHEIRRSERRIAERGFEYEQLTDSAGLEAAVDDFLRLHSSRMRSKFGEQFALSDEYHRFIARTTADLLAQGRLRLRFLAREGRRHAVIYLFRYGDVTYAEQSGFDELEARQDAMRSLWAYAIRQAIAEGCTMLDMLIGEQRYKSEFGATNVRTLSHVRAYSRTTLGAARRSRDGIALALAARRSGSLTQDPAT